MANGWAQDGAVHAQIDDSVKDEILRIRKQQPCGESLEFCEDCGDAIPEARQRAVPGVRLCIDCQEEADKESHAAQLYNRRGSKDSQLR